jgi:hypothetical protein
MQRGFYSGVIRFNMEELEACHGILSEGSNLNLERNVPLASNELA